MVLKPMMRVRIFVTHPVQYHVPLWRALAAHPELDVKVFYFSDHSVRVALDPEFGVELQWDVDLLSGYSSQFLQRDADINQHSKVAIADVDELIAREKPDWIWISGYNMAFERQLRRAAHRHGAKLLMRAEFSDLSYGPRSLMKKVVRNAYLRWFYRGIDAFCYPGQLARRHLERHGAGSKRMSFSPYSVDDQLLNRAKSELSRADARQFLGIPEGRFMLLFSGKLIERKDPLAVLDALKRMNVDNIGLIVLGDGALRELLETRGRELLGERLVVPGFVNQTKLAPYFRAADVFVMPSQHETWGLVVNEAMHHGLPAIVSDQVGCHSDLVVPGTTGFVYETGNTEALATHIKMLASDPARCSEMGRAAEQHVAAYTVQSAARGVFAALGCDPRLVADESPASKRSPS